MSVVGEAPMRLLLGTTLLAWMVIMLGAYVRLSDAGLGCPDWPGCYGRMIAPTSPEARREANAAFPHRPVETGKAWKEMAHRYAAGALGLLILAIAVAAWRRRRPGHWPILPTALVLLVAFQALLGMWTVTLLLKPTVVTLHLLGGMATLAMLCWLVLRNLRWRRPVDPAGPAIRGLALAALLVLTVQISLGGWTSTHYAAFFCPDFPTCQGQWLPPTDFATGFTLWHEGVQDYEGGILDNDAGVAVHLTHRIGAVVTTLLIGLLGLRLLVAADGPAPRLLGALLLVTVLAQFTLGVVLMRLPLALAVAHNGVAALLLALTITANFLLRSPRAAAPETL